MNPLDLEVKLGKAWDSGDEGDLQWQRNHEQIDEWCKKNDCTWYPANDFTLQIDWDHPTGEPNLNVVKGMLKHDGPITLIARTRSRSGNLHFYYQLPIHTNAMMRVFMQLLLGSDPVREKLNMMRVWRDMRDPIIMIEPNNPPPEPEDDVPF